MSRAKHDRQNGKTGRGNDGKGFPIKRKSVVSVGLRKRPSSVQQVQQVREEK